MPLKQSFKRRRYAIQVLGPGFLAFLLLLIEALSSESSFWP